MNALRLSEALGGKASGHRFKACCPAHNDNKPSLDMIDGEDGKLLFICRAGCQNSDVLKAIRAKGIEPFPKFDKPKVTQHLYCNKDETPVLKVVRTDLADDDKDFYQEIPDGPGWKPSGPAGETCVMPYKFHLWQTKEIFFTEGEKCADFLAAKGFTATTIFGGSNAKWRPEYDDAFRGKAVYIIPDNDKPGEKFAQNALAQISRVALSCQIVNLPMPEKWDVVDWFSDGGTAEGLRSLLSNLALPFEGFGFKSFEERVKDIPDILDAHAASLMKFGIKFLDDAMGGIIATDLVVLAAASGSGKTQASVNIVKEVILGGGRAAMYALEAFPGEIEMRLIFNLAITRYIQDGNSFYVSWGDWVKGKAEPRSHLQKY